MLIYPVEFIRARFKELDSLSVKGTEIINRRARSKCVRSLHLAMACERCGAGTGDGPHVCVREELVEAARLRMIAQAAVRRHRLGVAQVRQMRRNRRDARVLPPISTLLPPGEAGGRSVAPRGNAVPLGSPSAGDRPLGPAQFNRDGFLRPAHEIGRTPVFVVNGMIVDASGRRFCREFACEQPLYHPGRHGRWATCVECGLNYGASHLESCSQRPGFLEQAEKPGHLCQKKPFCWQPEGHRGPHRR